MSYMSGRPVRPSGSGNPKRTMTAQLRALGNTVAVLATICMVLLVAFVWMVTAINKQKKSNKTVDTTATTTSSAVQADSSSEPSDTLPPETTPESTPEVAHASFPEGTKLIALTFDDGPDKYTGQVLDALERNGVKATFYVIGSNVAGTDAAVFERMLSLGCEIGNHTWSHVSLRDSEYDVAYNELKKCDDALMEKIGQKATTIRPPTGQGLAQDALFQYSKDNHEYVVNWDDVSCPADWQKPALGDADYTAQFVIDNASDGTMVLLHDSHQSTADSLDKMIAGLKEKGYTFVTVSELLEARSASLGLTVDKALSLGWKQELLEEAYPGGPVYGVRYAYSSGKMMFEKRS